MKPIFPLFKIFSLLFLFIILNCKNENPKQAPKEQILPNTPEMVSKQWQKHLDHNELEKAAKLSTSKTKAWLTENKELFLNDKNTYQTEFFKMECEVKKEEAICHYIIKEEGELIEDFFLLKKINGQWLIDIEEDTDAPALEEAILKEMEKELKLSN